ncbi:TVP38/TMEM64 family protein [Bacilliculturomica massiliensis]|uniref:TVP38/TMEM64 family protein n=1 Tax=Bacilliculturomica massiliensis TaxID=1917867 RepID=UPI0010306853|nr:VTT domain-containing protein [Bacilliculturomica massiliensis]
MNEMKKQRWKRAFSILKLLVLIGIVAGIPALLYQADPDFIRQFKDLDAVNAYLDKYETASWFVYIGLQILQIIVSVIPGQMIQFAAGYAYVFWIAYLLSIAGIALGTIATFYLARLLGKDAMHVIFGEEKITYFVNHLNSKKAYITLFILFLIPGFPKDLITYAAGVSEIKITPFLILNLIGRSPALLATILMGSMTRTGSYIGMVILTAAVTVVFILCFIKRKKLIEMSDVIYARLLRTK